MTLVFPSNTAQQLEDCVDGRLRRGAREEGTVPGHLVYAADQVARLGFLPRIKNAPVACGKCCTAGPEKTTCVATAS